MADLELKPSPRLPQLRLSALPLAEFTLAGHVDGEAWGPARPPAPTCTAATCAPGRAPDPCCPLRRRRRAVLFLFLPKPCQITSSRPALGRYFLGFAIHTVTNTCYILKMSLGKNLSCIVNTGKSRCGRGACSLGGGFVTPGLLKDVDFYRSESQAPSRSCPLKPSLWAAAWTSVHRYNSHTRAPPRGCWNTWPGVRAGSDMR